MSATDPQEDVASQLVPHPGADARRTCYAGAMHRVRRGHPGFAPSFEKVTEFPGRMRQAARWPDLMGKKRPDKPWLDGMPRLIFVSDMGDAFSAAVSFEYLRDEVVAAATSDEGRRHVWMWLTKRPRRMAEFSAWLGERGIAWPANLWAGTTVTSQATTKRAKALLRVGDETTIRFLSVEPQTDHVTFGGEMLKRLNLIIQGGESGGRCRPFDIAWARALRDECRDAGTPYFLKQLGGRVVDGGKRVRFKNFHGGDWEEWSADLRVRQMPATTIDAAMPRPRVVRLPVLATAAPEPI